MGVELRRVEGLKSASNSWNHTGDDDVRKHPIAINIETKAPKVSWVEGKPQVAIWTDAWLHRLGYFYNEKNSTDLRWPPEIPAIPLLIVQGHDWHLLIAKRYSNEIVIWERIYIGSTLSYYDAMKVLAALHWLCDWAARVWRPWFLKLVGLEAPETPNPGGAPTEASPDTATLDAGSVPEAQEAGG
jgi:hypothetical protein